MSMITGCPACGTLFKVVPDQLKISDGWVRCGHCSEVFDAGAHMRQVVDGGDADAAAEASMTMSAPLTAVPPVASPAPRGEQELSLAPLSRPAPLEPTPAPAVPQAVPLPLKRPSGTPSELPSFFPSDAIQVREVDSPSQLDLEAPAGPRSELPPEVGYASPVDFVRSELMATRPRIELLDDDDQGPRSIYDPSLDAVTFVRKARRQAFWRRSGVRRLLLLASLLLALLLAAQVAVQERDRLAAMHPEWRGPLQALCRPLGCRIEPLRRIDAVGIDSSGFTRLRQDAYRLNVTLKNQAAQAVAIPAVELTLTDAQDQPLVRKVLTPRELGATSDTLPAHGDWSGTVAIAVGAPADSGRIAGYRVLAFYP
ncbi:DUF3426 domain-containing protein [Ramlibacter sp. MMS24-I3-19]|uniref:DUF3426 domain-containing protein n=1 Tax=Ramlibacter sp. MMS24-I3-19 TaxID=3416606 RepID=UPI003CFE0EF2